MKIQSDKILKVPTYPWIRFVDGYSAKVLSMRPTKDKEKDVWLMDLSPSDELIKRYKINANESFIVKTFPFDNIVQLSNDPIFTNYFCITTWDNQFTPATNYFKGMSQITRINELIEEKNRNRAELAKVKRDLELARADIPRYMKENMGTLLEVMGPALRDMVLSSMQNPGMVMGGTQKI